jgi:hypothetical protein
MGLLGELAEEWNNYIGLIYEKFISLDNDILDSFIWMKKSKRTFTS